MAVNGEATKTVPYAEDDVRRAREFYNYFQPDNLVQPHLRRRVSILDAPNDLTPNLSQALSPFCQLTALRCNVQKAMINVMDREIMYFLSEATKISAGDTEEGHRFVEDPIFLTCSSVPLKDRICEMTIRLDNSDAAAPTPMFVIPDLSVSRFASMSIIAGPPHYRFYAGVPITTRNGVNIGSLAIMDTRARPHGLTPNEEAFLASTAEQIMFFLETNRQAIEGRHSRRMAEGLEAFIAGRKSLLGEKPGYPQQEMLKRRSKLGYGISLPADMDHPEDENGIPQDVHSQEFPESEFSTSDPSEPNEPPGRPESDGESRHSRTFGRAANLLRECLGDLGEGGSVAFIPLNIRLSDRLKRRSSTAGTPAIPKSETGSNDKSGSQETAPSSFLACSTQTNPFSPDKALEESTRALDDEILQEMVTRYPGGRLWSLDVSNSSSSEDDTDSQSYLKKLADGPHKRSRRKQLELTALRKAFPSAGQVMFAPLWDASVGSFAYGCFVATALDTRSFNPAVELPFLNSFCSTVMAECSRLDTMMADKQKSDFVGTISHEMRSPLHGLLASVEFLSETDLNGFQRSLISTIDSCGRTLLDTINHVLDFSKINSFQKHWQASNKKHSHSSRRHNFLGPDNSSKSISHGAPALLQLFSVIDVSAVLEEVVDGLVLGRTYNSGIDFTDMSREGRNHDGVRPSDPVKIVLDVQRADWSFVTQPGAVRRIIMNITGNAIKYTNQGSITVRLRLQNPEEEKANEVMVLTVTDTGKGISQEFLSSKLFVPFAQENSLAPGTGLGLSIVRSIVLMLGGTIDVKSKVNQGTTVEVALPIKRPLPGQSSSQATPHSNSTTSSGCSTFDNSISTLQSQTPEATVTFYHPLAEEGLELSEVVRSYVQDWYHLQFVDQDLCESATVVVVEETSLDHLLKKVGGTPGHRPALVVMCSVLSKHSAAMIRTLEERLGSAVEFVSEPCGPHKLARSIRLALEKKQALKLRLLHSPNPEKMPRGTVPVLTAVPKPATESLDQGLGEMDLNAPGETDSAKLVQATETFAASQGSSNAQMAIYDPITALRTPRTHVSEGDAFPFPMHTEESSRIRREPMRQTSSDKVTLEEIPNAGSSSPSTPKPIVDMANPNILLVDDNIINLKLLGTFLKAKRKYTRIEQAQDGQEAVDKVLTAKEPFDIIFMDISMPVMNGFEATRAIRDFEEGKGIKPGAMVIALTGLASARDQSEVFNSGCDIYMTKPVSFKEVGKLLNNWEAHRDVNPP